MAVELKRFIDDEKERKWKRITKKHTHTHQKNRESYIVQGFEIQVHTSTFNHTITTYNPYP